MAVWCVNKILPLMEYSQLNYFNMKLKFGAIVVAGSGKIGGHVASKNKAGAYLRTKVTPSNPRTTYQTNVRERLAGLSQGWRSLTDAQRNSWNNAVANFKRSNVFGDIKIPSGFNLYQRINNNILTIGGTILTVPPTPSSVATYSNAVLTAAAGTPALSLAFTVVAGSVAGYKLFATAPVSPGKTNVSNAYRLIGVALTNAISPFNILSLYTAKFGSVGVAGQRIDVKIVGVGATTGIEGVPVTATAIVAA